MFVFVAKNDIHQMKQSANQILTINNNLMENNHSLKRTLQLYYLVLLMGGNQHYIMCQLWRYCLLKVHNFGADSECYQLVKDVWQMDIRERERKGDN